VLALVLAAALATAGCGRKVGQGRASLSWAKRPQVNRVGDLPRDRVLVGVVRNDSFGELDLRAADLRVRDREGRALRTSGRYLASFVHGLYGAFQQPSSLPVQEQRRLGLIASIAPGGSTTLWIAYRLAPGTKLPLRVDYGSGELTVPGST
jgi:hypothetical protein